MTLMALTELGIKDIWGKALTLERGKIAQRVGAHHVVYPEADMGERVANLITGRLIDFIEFDDGFALAKIHAPTVAHNRKLEQSAIRSRYGVTVVGLKRANQDFQHATTETLVMPGDLLIVSGPTGKIQCFAGQGKKP